MLRHGFPETWYCWRHQIPVLAEKFRVIVPDLRGYGGTEKPPSGYDKRLRGAFNDYHAGREDVLQDEGRFDLARDGAEIPRFSRCPSVATFRTKRSRTK